MGLSNEYTDARLSSDGLGEGPEGGILRVVWRGLPSTI